MGHDLVAIEERDDRAGHEGAEDHLQAELLRHRGFTEQGERVLVGVCLGMRESHEDWLGLARDLIGRGLPAPMPIVADGARA
jgi:hypothetical protein